LLGINPEMTGSIRDRETPSREVADLCSSRACCASARPPPLTVIVLDENFDRPPSFRVMPTLAAMTALGKIPNENFGIIPNEKFARGCATAGGLRP
jgi:hypothetical protein